jgi:anaerobic C4-dicarboxylate transporter
MIMIMMIMIIPIETTLVGMVIVTIGVNLKTLSANDDDNKLLKKYDNDDEVDDDDDDDDDYDDDDDDTNRCYTGRNSKISKSCTSSE